MEVVIDFIIKIIIFIYFSPLRYTSPDFLYVRSWLPCIFFSGGVTVGNIGRQLAMVNFTIRKD